MQAKKNLKCLYAICTQMIAERTGPQYLNCCSETSLYRYGANLNLPPSNSISIHLLERIVGSRFTNSSPRFERIGLRFMSENKMVHDSSLQKNITYFYEP